MISNYSMTSSEMLARATTYERKGADGADWHMGFFIPKQTIQLVINAAFLALKCVSGYHFWHRTFKDVEVGKHGYTGKDYTSYRYNNTWKTGLYRWSIDLGKLCLGTPALLLMQIPFALGLLYDVRSTMQNYCTLEGYAYEKTLAKKFAIIPCDKNGNLY